MSTQLIQILTFTDVAAGDDVTLPHNINVNGRALTPDIVMQDSADFTIDSVNDTEVTVTNTSGAPATLNVWLEFKHTTQRWFGSVEEQDLVPQPFIPAVGSGGGGGGDPAVIFDDAVAAAKVNIRSDRASNQSPIDNTKVGITNLGSKTSGASAGATANYATIGGGDRNQATAIGATVSGGQLNTASGVNASVAGGTENTASGTSAHAEGQENIVAATYAHVEGYRNTVTVDAVAAHAEGRDNTVSQPYAHVEGQSCQATASYAHAEGLGSIASGGSSHAEGNTTTASTSNAHAEGNNTLASGQSSHAQGNSTTASGFNAHAEGRLTTASGDYSHAQGLRSIASRETQFAHASGRIANNGDAQTSMIVWRLDTTNAPLAAAPMEYGDGSTTLFSCEDGKAYACSFTAIAGGGAGGAISAMIKNDFLVRTIGGVATIIQVGTPSIIGHATATANWTITPAVFGGPEFQLTFDTNADNTTQNISVAVRFEFTECPISA